MTSLKKQTVSGIKWQVSSSFLQKAISMGATIFLARILGPNDFGLFALAFVAIDAFGLFKSIGFDAALVQRKDNFEKAANTAFIVVPILGSIIYLILALLAPLIGKFLNSYDVVGIIRALGIIFILSCLGKVPSAIMEKNMQFKLVSIIEIYTTIIYALSSIIFALLEFGVWSLVIGHILRVLSQNVLFMIFSKWRPKIEFDKKIALEMFHYGKFIFLTSAFWFVRLNLDNILVGKLLGVVSLGIYAIAFNIANFGSSYFSDKVARVIFPAFTKVQNDKYDLKLAFLKTTKYASMVAFPFCVVLFFFGGDIVKVVYGNKWLAVIPVLQVLSFAGLFNTLPIAFGPLFNATGHPKSSFFFSTIQIMLFVIGIIPAAKLYGAVGVGFVVSISSLIPILCYLPLVRRLISSTYLEIYQTVKPALLGAIIMSSLILIFRFTFRINYTTSGIYSYIIPLLIFLLGFIFYGISLSIIDKTTIKKIWYDFALKES